MKISDGLSQNNRSYNIMDDDYFRIDEWSLHDRICFMKDFAKNIKFFNTSNIHDGYWSELLNSDELIVLSEIQVINISYYEKDFLKNYNNIAGNSDSYLLKQLNCIFELACYFNHWYKKLHIKGSYNHEGFINEIAYLIRNKLSYGLDFYKSILHSQYLSIPKDDIEEKTKDFGFIWEPSESIPIKDNFQKINKKLKNTFYDFNNSVYFLKQTASKYMEKSLKSKDHAPYISMLFAYARLFEHASSKLNAFTHKYSNFYYNKVLNIKPLKHVPDKTFLLFTLKPGIKNSIIQKDERFLAGKDKNKKKIYFKADNDLVINTCKVGKILTLFLEKNELISPQSGWTDMLKDGIPPLSIENYKPEELKNYPLFGGPLRKPGIYAEIGLAIADDVFLVNEGRRKIHIEFCFSEDSFEAFQTRLTDIKEEYEIAEVFIKLFSNMFMVYITTNQGWYKVDNYIINNSLINTSQSKNSISLSFVLMPEDPPIVCYLKELHEGEFSEESPVIKLILNNESYLFPYSLIDILDLESIKSRVEVSEIKDLLLVNELGHVDISQPFYPFGVSPGVNSFFLLSNYEMANKNLCDLSIFIRWINLPTDERGLSGYFDAYEQSVGKKDYKCSVSFLNNGKWLPEKEAPQQIFQLFPDNSDVPHEKLEDYSHFSEMDTFYFRPAKRKLDRENFKYDNYTKGGFVRFNLESPVFGFGFKDYSTQLSKIILHNAQKKRKLPVVNAPFSPLADYITLEYTAESTMYFSHDISGHQQKKSSYYHLHPWGFEEINLDDGQHTKKFVPEYNDQGNLFIGLKEFEAEKTVSLFFNLIDDSTPEHIETPPEIKWEYLSTNVWKSFPKTNIISDSTHKFLESGIITIKAPEDINQDNTILGEDLFWIKISANNKLDAICSLTGVSTQALCVTRDIEGTPDNKSDVFLPAMTITKPEHNLPGIKQIFQISNSENGKPQESSLQTRIRVGERLKHKCRAVTPWDYEQLILEEFPEIFKVKCFPNMNFEGEREPGKVLTVVIRKETGQNQTVNPEPMVNNTQLNKIASFLKTIASPSADIEVRNPVYEQVQVKCSVLFKPGLDEGYFINQLNKDLVSFISPDQSNNENEPGFGKVIKCIDVLSFIQSQDYVVFATNFSLLHVTLNIETKYNLVDTAERTFIQKVEHPQIELDADLFDKQLSPSYPWGLLVSAPVHSIHTINNEELEEPVKTGIDEIKVGVNFIIK
jgi:hypothetical protein